MLMSCKIKHAEEFVSTNLPKALISSWIPSCARNYSQEVLGSVLCNNCGAREYCYSRQGRISNEFWDEQVQSKSQSRIHKRHGTLPDANSHFNDPSRLYPQHCSVVSSSTRPIYNLLWNSITSSPDVLSPWLRNFGQFRLYYAHHCWIYPIWKFRWSKQYPFHTCLDTENSCQRTNNI